MKNGFTVTELILVVVILGVLMLFAGKCSVDRERDCQTVCGTKPASVERNTRGSDKCWCADDKGELHLKKVYEW